MGSPDGRTRAVVRRAALALPPVRRLVDDRQKLRGIQAAQLADIKSAKRRVAELEVQVATGAGPQSVEYEYLFIITYGRSGSTLLQGILCSIPGVLIRGENHDSLHRLFAYQRALTDAKATFASKRTLDPKNPWFGIERWDADESLAGLRALVLQTLLRPEPDTRIIGFKEIRWWHKDWEAYLAFLLDLFPGARFVMNTREHESVARSKWWANKADPLATLADYEKRLDEMAEFLGDAVYRVHFDDYVADPDVLAGLFAWLGEPFDRAAVQSVMSVRHSV